MDSPIFQAPSLHKLPVALLFFAAQMALAVDGSNFVKAIEDGKVEVVESTLAAGVSPNWVKDGYGTALQIATDSVQLAIVRLLISAGADVNGTSDDDDRTPLHIAIDAGNAELTDYLLTNGASVDKTDSQGQSPIFVAIQNNDQLSLAKLLAHGADVNIEDDAGLTPLVATIASNPAIATLLLDKGANIDGEKIARMTICARCHGATGLGSPYVATTPYLAGQKQAYLEKQLLDYREKRRHFSVMNRTVLGMNAAVMKSVAAYYSRQEWSFLGARKALGGAEEGARLFASGTSSCASCHGNDGISSGDRVTPTIAGMTSDYVTLQLKRFRDGHRKNDLNASMRTALKGWSDEQISDVAAFVESLR